MIFIAFGHIDHHVKQSIKAGVPVLDAYAMASLNAAIYYRFDHVLGSITPTRRADLLVLEDLSTVNISATYQDGKLSSEQGVVLFSNEDSVPPSLYNTVKLERDLAAEDFKIQVDDRAAFATVRAMEMYDGYFKRAFEIELIALAGDVIPSPIEDVSKVFVVDRHHRSGKKAGGFVRGFDLNRGAIASTTNCENQNLVVLGTNNADMAFSRKYFKRYRRRVCRSGRWKSSGGVGLARCGDYVR